ncbi:MAG TPA: hypothetical protein EYG94_02580 [Campylobacterales bacterium]|nr:hypothetical protein [Campylobacterales bacterium]
MNGISKNFLLKLLLFFYLSFSYMGATHIHYDHEEHLDDCQICLIVNAFSDLDIPKNSLILSCTLCSYIIEVFNTTSVHTVHLKGYFSNAPPTLSF